MTYYGLFALQHRGQESAGIAVSDGEKIKLHKNLGLVSDVFVQGHFEYDRRTLENEYKRDVNKGLDIQVPKNYYPDNDPNNKPNLLWRAHANTLYTNWLNYYVYQLTPYDMDTIGEDSVYTHAAACSLVVESNG